MPHPGVFTLSLDFELIWGTVHRHGPEAFRAACERERTRVIDRLLALFAEFDIAATWCVVGHLFLDSCAPVDGRMHPEIVPPGRRGGGDWFAADPGTSEARDPIFYGRSLLDKIVSCPVRQEIGCHSFSHVIFDDPGCSRQTVESELRRCVALAAEMGITMRSFVYPRNRVGHLDVLPRYGFTCYRGPEALPSGRLGGPVRRAAHLVSVLGRQTPAVVMPVETLPGLWNIPASMVYLPGHGARRFVPISYRVARALKGLRRAATDGRIFHFWFHPTNLAHRTAAMFAGLRAILTEVRAMRERGVLEVFPMGELAARAARNAMAAPMRLPDSAVKENR